MILAIKLLLVLCVLYVAVVLAACAAERSLVYFPDRRRIQPETLSLAPINESILKTEDGERIVVWTMKGEPGKPMLVYFHGNGGGLIDRVARFPLYREAGLAVAMMSYRSYSGSTGKPTEANNVADADLLLRTVVAAGAPPSDIVLYGESLGTGVAVQLAAKYDVRAVVLEAPYSSIVDVARWRLPFLPVGLLMRDRYESMKYIGAVRAPILVIHGERDGIVPIRFGRKLFGAADEPKRFNAYPNGGHNDLYEHGAWRDIAGFLAEPR